MQNSLLKSFFGLANTLIVIILLCINCIKLIDNFTYAEALAFGILGIIIAYQTCLLTWYRFKHERNAKYGEAMKALGSGFSQIHYYNRLPIEKKNDKTQLLVLDELCSSISLAFSILTGSSCSVSIKYLTQSDINTNEIQVKTLSRDNQVGLNRRPTDKYEHLLKDNSDFERIMHKEGIGEGSYFMSNQLPRILDYKNSSLKYCNYQPKSFGTNAILNYFIGYIRLLRWPLPYRSCIIVPIIPIRYDPDLSFEVLGFLCVDSSSLRAFRFRHDVDLLKGVADGIYKELDTYLS